LKELETVSSGTAISETIAAVSELILMGDYNDAIEKIDAYTQQEGNHDYL
jgi:exonuclease III